MSVLTTDLEYYGSANMPEADSVTVGGAVDFSKQVIFNDVTPTGAMDFVSSSASDTATKIQIAGRDSTGVIQTPAAITLTGTTKVTSLSQTFERLLYGAITGAAANGPLANPGGTAAVGDIAAMARTLTITAHTGQAGSANSTATNPPVMKLQAGDGASVAVGQIIRTTGGTGPNQLRRIIAINPNGLGADFVAVNGNWGTVPDATTTYEVAQGFLFSKSPNAVTAVIRAFSTSSADVSGGSNRTYYEKVVAVNNNTTLALTAASIIKLVDPAGATALNFALTTALNDTGTVANRQTAPVSGITAFSSGVAPQTIAVPSPQNLPSGAAPNAAGAQGIWLALVLNAGNAAAKTSMTVRMQGSST